YSMGYAKAADRESDFFVGSSPERFRFPPSLWEGWRINKQDEPGGMQARGCSSQQAWRVLL
ncbi:MAG TPA: hypothetical protein PLV85_04175, partial [Polyangiaceae bacterium]|nr:hypothetical protein [Polyangiaceae bacterium]